ncbi:hypothetical protein [Rubellicoccus peritrichatus]|uniref:Uncharacterized protein n=1 Tax=Rubellicoccus peritrichatus TaxID=3080537 RepID=A0AAQ3QSZ9_9BACT|nr:hypothetical protein [Puniceicoccus sp. CR14]WOO43148.1 hypothetical protein RZN69_08585 [Puniceicoccus sp. CR14]
MSARKAAKKAVSKKKRQLVDSYVALAKALGYTRQQVDNWKKDPRYKDEVPQPEANGKHDVASWKTFIKRHNLRGDEVSEDVLLKRRKEELAIASQEFKLERERGKYVEREAVAKSYKENLSILFRELRRRFESTAPPQYKGQPESECAQINRRELDELQEQMHERAKRITE